MRSPARRREKNSTPPTPRRTAWAGEEPREYEEVGKLPLPELSDTMAQYLDNVKPLVSDVLYSETEGIVDKFSAKDGVGQKVMMVLEERREKLDNWAYDYWLNDMYLNQRLPLPVNFNPAMVLPRRKFNNPSQMLCYTARYVSSLIKYSFARLRWKLADTQCDQRTDISMFQAGSRVCCLEVSPGPEVGGPGPGEVGGAVHGPVLPSDDQLQAAGQAAGQAGQLRH